MQETKTFVTCKYILLMTLKERQNITLDSFILISSVCVLYRCHSKIPDFHFPTLANMQMNVFPRLCQIQALIGYFALVN